MASGRASARCGVGAVDEPAGHSDDRVRMVWATVSCPAGCARPRRAVQRQVVGEHGAAQPGGVGEELARRAVLEPGTCLEVADRELDGGGSRWNPSTATVASSTLVTNVWCRQWGHS